MASLITISSLFCFVLLFTGLSPGVRSQPISFTYNGFNGSDLIRGGTAAVNPGGALMLTDDSRDAIGRAFYRNAITMFNSSNNTLPAVSSFSTHFVFSIVPSESTDRGGYGLVFVMSPDTTFLGAEANHFLGIFSSQNDGNDSNHIFAVEFDTVNGHNDEADLEGEHVGIDLNGLNSSSEQASGYHKYNSTNNEEAMGLETGNPVYAWIDYDGSTKELKVTVSPKPAKPSLPLLSQQIPELSEVLKERMFVGFSAATGKEKASSHFILGWSFQLNGVVAPLLDPSRLPVLTSAAKRKSDGSSSFKASIKALIAALSAALFLLFVTLFVVRAYRKNMEDLEDWELDCPHRFRYRDLYSATKGFAAAEVIGAGGFGTVYRGRLGSSGGDVAVKRISRNSIQGLREFAAEIESLGRLRHKHLVNLQGWCKRNNDLLLVYDYVSNGSLDSLLFSSTGEILRWDRRFNILKGVAAGLLYLHEEWDRVVIHRDVKSSNVLVDAEMNGRLGDFGLARLYDRSAGAAVDKAGSHTTAVVGTVGYIAPELTRTGKASTRSDVFAFGVLLLEVASGRRPVDPDSESGHLVLVDWVMECQQMGRVLDASDPKLIFTGFAGEEMERVFTVGLLCCHPDPELRPGMREVVGYLNGETIAATVNWGSSSDLQRLNEINSRLLEVISHETVSGSYRSASIGAISSNSINAGR